jgi:hypothetical protein
VIPHESTSVSPLSICPRDSITTIGRCVEEDPPLVEGVLCSGLAALTGRANNGHRHHARAVLPVGVKFQPRQGAQRPASQSHPQSSVPTMRQCRLSKVKGWPQSAPVQIVKSQGLAPIRPQVIQQRLGHKSIENTMVYLAIASEYVDRTVASAIETGAVV